MSPQTAKYHGGYHLKAVCEFNPIEPNEGKLAGELIIETPTSVPDSVSYEIIDVQNLMIAPFEVKAGTGTDPTEVKIRITGDKPKLAVQPKTHPEDNLPTFALYFPPEDILPFCTQYVEQGISSELVDGLQNVYSNSQKVALHRFLSDAMNYLEYDQYLQLQKQVAEYDSQVREELAETRHRMFKNMLRGQKAGNQFPVTSVDEFQARLENYNRQELDVVLGEIDGTKVVEMVIDIASSRNTYVDDICKEVSVITAFADSISTGHFVNILSQSLIEYAPSEADDITADTVQWRDSVALDPEELILRRFSGQDTYESYNQLREAAYESQDLDLFKQSLAASRELETKKFHQAAADLVYWYTEITSAIPSQVRSRVYGVAEGLYRKVGNTYMADAAYYRKCRNEGFTQQRHEDYRAAGMAFSQAYNIATQKDEDAAPFDELDSFMQIVETNIKKHRDEGEFLKGINEAQTGLEELQEGSLRDTQTDDVETLLYAWKDDLTAQHQQQDGRFEEAIKTTEKAIAGFRQVQATPEAQTAQTRRLQLEAITSQLALNFEAASDIHQKAAKEIRDTNQDTAYFHEIQSKICEAKQALLDDNIEEAERKIKDFKGDSSSTTNLLVLTKTYQQYNNDNLINTAELLEWLEIHNQSKSKIGRHISYDGDYASVAILISASQTLKETGVPTDLLDQIIRAALKDAVSGGSTREWQEISELSQIDTSNIWRQLLPSAFTEAIEDVEQIYHQPSQNYMAPTMELLAVLEGYLRIMAEYYARLEHEDWRSAVETQDSINMADLEMFFASDPATERIESTDTLNQRLRVEKYFDTDCTLREVRNDLDHGDHNFVDEETFIELRDDVYGLMCASIQDLPVIAEVIDIREQTGVHLASLDWNLVPRRVNFQIAEALEQNQTVYLPPDIEIESGFADVKDDKVAPCTTMPSDSQEMTL